MSRPERVGRLLRQIEHETQAEFDEHTELFNLNNQLKAENAELRKFATEVWELLTCNEPNFVWSGLQKKARELGIEVEE